MKLASVLQSKSEKSMSDKKIFYSERNKPIDQRACSVKDSIEICSKCVGLCQLLNFYLDISSGAAVKLE